MDCHFRLLRQWLKLIEVQAASLQMAHNRAVPWEAQPELPGRRSLLRHQDGSRSICFFMKISHICFSPYFSVPARQLKVYTQHSQCSLTQRQEIPLVCEWWMRWAVPVPLPFCSGVDCEQILVSFPPTVHHGPKGLTLTLCTPLFLQATASQQRLQN